MFASERIIDPFWNAILTQKGVQFMVKYGKQEIVAMYFLQGIYWNKQINYQLKAGDKLTIPVDKNGIISGCTYKIMNSGIVKMDAEEQQKYKYNKDYVVSKKYTSGMLFKYKGLVNNKLKFEI